MTLLATIAAIILAYLAACLALAFAVRLAIRLAKLVRQTRNNAESDDAELCGFFIVPEIDSVHNGGVNSK